jgi:hypothetical protein
MVKQKPENWNHIGSSGFGRKKRCAGQKSFMQYTQKLQIKVQKVDGCATTEAVKMVAELPGYGTNATMMFPVQDWLPIRKSCYQLNYSIVLGRHGGSHCLRKCNPSSAAEALSRAI